MDGERIDHDAFRAIKGIKYVTEQDWSNLLKRLSKLEQDLERMKANDRAIHDHHTDGGPS